MTGRATGQNIRCLDVILLLQIDAFGDLGFRAISRSPLHIENLFFRPHKVFRPAMTLKTPFHLQRASLRHYRHLIDAAMAGRTAHAFVNVNRVIEIGKVRQVVDADPFQRFTRLETRAHRFQVGTVRPNLLMTVHADGRGRNTGRGGSLNRRVAIAAINAVVADVVLMTELDWLLAFDPLAGVPSRPGNLCRDPKSCKQNKDGAVNRGPRQIVRAVTENLWHSPWLKVFVGGRTCPLIAANRRNKSRL
jgi:hypothetical protein